jgi:O-antigen/teichoic acid export membrane protein
MAQGADEHLPRSAATLSAGVGAAGVLTYAYFALASHNLDSVAYGEVVVLWSSVFLTISVLHRPIEQFVSRSVAEHRARSEPLAPTLRTAAMLQGGIALAFALIALALRGPLEDELFSGDATLYWIYVAAVLCFAASFFARGYLAGRGRFALLSGLLVCESASRAAFALAVALGIATGKDAVALGIVAAPLFSLVVVPLAFGVRSGDREPVRPASPASSVRRGGAFAAAVFFVMLAEQTLLNGGPLLVRGLEGAAAAGFIFNVLMLARAPLVVFQGVAISLLPHLTRLRAGGSEREQEEFALSVGQTLRAVAAFTAVVAAIVAVAGPELMQAAFGDRFEYDRAGLLIVTAAMGLYLGATTVSQATLAQGQARRAAIAWVICALGFLAWSASGVIEAVDRRVEVGFALAAAALLAALWRIYRSAPATARDPVLPSSAEETEARLALADEAS